MIRNRSLNLLPFTLQINGESSPNLSSTKTINSSAKLSKQLELLTVLDALGFGDIKIEESHFKFSASVRRWCHMKDVTKEDGEEVAFKATKTVLGTMLLSLTLLLRKTG